MGIPPVASVVFVIVFLVISFIVILVKCGRLGEICEMSLSQSNSQSLSGIHICIRKTNKNYLFIIFG
jgi:hypothetical protein